MNRSIVTTLIGLGLSAAVLTSAPALAQTAGSTAPREKCALPPGQAPNAPQGQQPGKTARSPQGSAPDLADCNGVLKAPSVGDHDMVEPAPPVGEMPVIKPGDLPQNKAPGSGGG
jgi:hypothetical protein